jgi:hemerythrin superfamily protein
MNPLHQESARATDFLRVDHAWVKQLFNEYCAAMQADLPRATVAAEICRNVEAHCEAEATMLYPMVRHEVEALVHRLVQERDAILACIAEVRAFAYDPPARDVLMTQLMRLVERHAEAEERELFPLIEERMPATVRRLHPGVVQARHAAHIDGPAERVAAAA